MRQIVFNLNNEYSYSSATLRQGENLGTNLVIKLTEDFLGYNYRLALQNNSSAELYTPELLPNQDNEINYEIPIDVVRSCGILKVVLLAFEMLENNNERIIKSAILKLKVEASVNGDSEIVPKEYIPWYTKAEEFANVATDKASEAMEQAEIATQAVENINEMNETLQCTIDNATQINEAMSNEVDGTIKKATDIDLTLKDSIDDGIQINTILVDNTVVADSLNNSLVQNTDDGNTTKDNLVESIELSQTTKSNLDDSIDIATTKKSDLDGSIGVSNTKKSELDESIGIGNALKINLDDDISVGNTLKENLEHNIIDASQLMIDLPLLVEGANTSKANLDEIIIDANAINAILSDEVTGTIKQATDINVALEGNIDDAELLKDTIEQAIVNNQIATKTEVGDVNILSTTSKIVVGAINELNSAKIKKYGVKFTGSNPAGERTDDAIGMVANVAVNDEIVLNDFDKVSFFNRPICNGYHDVNGKFNVLAYRGEPGFSMGGGSFPPLTEKTEVFYECTPFYWNNSLDEPSASATPLEGYELAPMFINGNDKVYLPVFWLAMVNGKATSRSGLHPDYDSLNGHMTKARTYHSKAHTETMAVRISEYVLQLIEFATRDVQNIMMGASSLDYNSTTSLSTVAENGVNRIIVSNATATKYVTGQTIVIGTAQNGSNIADRVVITSIETFDAGNKAMHFDGNAVNIPLGAFISSRAWRNGATDIVVASSGSPGSNSSGRYPCIWRGKVDPWANGYSAICDILIERTGESPHVYSPWFLPDPRKYAGGVITADYIKLNYNLATGDGYAKTLGLDPRFRWLRLTTEVGASSTTYLTGYYYYSRSAIGVVFVGGYFYYGRLCSPVYFHCDYAPGASLIYRLSRLLVTS